MSYLLQNIKYLRNEKNISAAEFKKSCRLTASAAKIKSGKFVPSPDELIRISEILNCPADKLLKSDIAGDRKKIKNFRMDLLALDVDGVLTDGGMHYTQKGDEFKKFSTKDGLAIIKMVDAGHRVAFISSGVNDRIIKERAKHLGVQYVYVGTWKKLEILEKWCKELKTDLSHVAYIGDDMNDIRVINKVGLSACPANAALKVKLAATVVLDRKGGKGCVREFIERFVMEIL